MRGRARSCAVVRGRSCMVVRGRPCAVVRAWSVMRGRARSVVRGRSCVVVCGRACVVGHSWSCVVVRGLSCVVVRGRSCGSARFAASTAVTRTNEGRNEQHIITPQTPLGWGGSNFFYPIKVRVSMGTCVPNLGAIRRPVRTFCLSNL